MVPDGPADRPTRSRSAKGFSRPAIRHRASRSREQQLGFVFLRKASPGPTPGFFHVSKPRATHQPQRPGSNLSRDTRALPVRVAGVKLSPIGIRSGFNVAL